MNEKLCIILILALYLTSNTLANTEFNKDYVSVDEPTCNNNCSSITDGEERLRCYKDQLNFYNYKLVKSIFNYGKTVIYNSLWVNRYEKPDNQTFERVFNETLEEYKQSNLLGNLNYDKLRNIATFMYTKMRAYADNTKIEYSQYPSLKCPIPCTYDLTTWQTLVGISVGIFVLALITTGIYSVYLHKQYSILRTRMKSIRYTNINS